MRLQNKIIKLLIGLSLLAFTACLSDDESTDSDSSSVISHEQTFTAATGAVTSIYSGVTALTTITCDDSGSPTSSAPGDAQYAGEDAYCALNTNSKSPDTIQGSYFLVSAILCAIENTISFAYENTATDHNVVTFREDDPCFGTDGFDATDDGDTLDIFPLALQDIAIATGEYDYLIKMQLGATIYDDANPATVKFYLKDSDGIVAARIYSAAFAYTVEFVMDSNIGKFYYESKDYGANRHIRLAATGTFSTTTGSFSTVTDAKYIHTEGEESSGSSRSAMMNFDGNGDDYDHHIDGVRDGDYSALVGFAYDAAFYQWTGLDIADHTPDTDGILDLSTFNMTF